jgi:hypothetical protein
MSEEQKKATATLTDDDIVTEKGREVGRRTAVGLLGAAAAASAVAMTGCVVRRPANVVVVGASTGITDRDGGPCADPAGNGRGVTGITDADAGGCADPAGRGRGAGARQVVVQQPQGLTDNDSGACADPAGGGRGYSGMTDSDGGYCSDPGGRGVRGY